MVASRADLRQPLEQLVRDFEDARSEFFSADDLARGAFFCPDPDGTQRRLDLTSLRVVYLDRPLQRVPTPRHLYDLARALRAGSDQPLNGILLDRRRGGVAARKTA